MTKPATTTPDPEFNIPPSGEPDRPKKPDPPQAQAVQTPGRGGAPGMGQHEDDDPDPSKGPPAHPGSDGLQGARPGTIYSPGEGVNEEEQKRSGLRD
jgi:hypothetical protein